jgi:uncharacterized protein YllA (UPF0747 family)
MRALLEPLGIAVLDAAHPAVRCAGAPTVRSALMHASEVSRALSDRDRAIAAAGYRAQVQTVSNLSLVFLSDADTRKRVPVKNASTVMQSAADQDLGPNVLLRPVVERQILPTVTYVAGPAEFAYFAQVSAVADVVGVARPRVVHRWSGLILEPHVAQILETLHVTPDDFRDPHTIEGRVAREGLPASVRDALAALRETVRTHAEPLRHSDVTLPALERVVDGFERQMGYRIDRLERRFVAAVKRSGTALLHDVAAARASLYPNGIPQERALNFIPFLARYGYAVRDRMIEAARHHAELIVGHGC